MRITIPVLLVFTLWSNNAISQVQQLHIRPLANGDRVLFELLNATQTGNAPHQFVVTRTYTHAMEIGEDGIRKYTRPAASSNRYVNFAYDKSHSIIISENQLLPEERIFRRLPQGELRPGMTWQTPPSQFQRSCGPTSLTMKAVSSPGPFFSILVDGRETSVDTIRINYEGRVQACGGGSWRHTRELYFAPGLGEFVGSRNINWQGDSPIFIYNGDGFNVKAILTAP